MTVRDWARAWAKAWASARVAILRDGPPFRGRLSSGLRQGTLAAVAALLAYIPARALGVQEGFWGAITAISVLQTEFKVSWATARDQFLGAAVGGAIAVVVLLLLGQDLASYAVAVILSLLVAWIINVPSAARLAGVTATIILLVPRSGSAARMFVSRLSEVGWGVCVAISIVWISDHAIRLLRAARDKRIATETHVARGRPDPG